LVGPDQLVRAEAEPRLKAVEALASSRVGVAEAPLDQLAHDFGQAAPATSAF